MSLRLSPLLWAAAALVAGASASAGQEVKPIAIEGVSPPATSAITAQPGAARPEGALDCAIRPSRVVEVASPIDGVLAEVLVAPGQIVAKGDLIARIDTDIAAADLANAQVRAEAKGALGAAQARAAAAGAQYRAQKQAFEARVAPRVDFERARGDLRVAQEEVRRETEALLVAEADEARMALIVAKGEIRAPFAGVIGEELLNPSEAIEGRPVAQLIVIEPMRIEAFATVEAAAAIREGAEYVAVTGFSAPVIEEITLDYVSPLADTSSQTIRVYYELTSQNTAPGYRCFLATPEAAERHVAAAAQPREAKP